MIARDLISESYNAMRYNRRRTTLTMLGMAWGIATVVLLLAYGTGWDVAIHNIFSEFGAKVMGVFPGHTSLQAGGVKAGIPVRLQMDDVDRIATTVPLVWHISPEAMLSAQVEHEGRSEQTVVESGNESLLEIRNINVEEGRTINAEDVARRGRVAVIGPDLKTKLFSNRPALGDSIRVNGISFQVIGVYAAKMQESDDNVNDLAFIPYSTMGDLQDTRYLGGIWLDYQTADYLRVEDLIRQNLAASHNFDPHDKQAVFIFNAMKGLHQFEIIDLGLQVLLAFIGALTLGIGGVGLMNIMLVSVTQRTREIGVEKALGARRRDILLQFLAEALAITAAGGVLGVMLAYAVSFTVGRLTLFSALAKHAERGDIQLAISPVTLIVATAILGVVGIISGMLPAVKAANLDPIEALRYE